MKQYKIEAVVDAHDGPQWMGKPVAKAPIAANVKTQFVIVMEEQSPGLFTASLWEKGDWTTHHLYRAIGNCGYGAVMTRVRLQKPENMVAEVERIVKILVGQVSDAKPKEKETALLDNRPLQTWGVVAFYGAMPQTTVIEIPDA